MTQTAMRFRAALRHKDYQCMRVFQAGGIRMLIVVHRDPRYPTGRDAVVAPADDPDIVLVTCKEYARARRQRHPRRAS